MSFIKKQQFKELSFDSFSVFRGQKCMSFAGVILFIPVKFVLNEDGGHS